MSHNILFRNVLYFNSVFLWLLFVYVTNILEKGTRCPDQQPKCHCVYMNNFENSKNKQNGEEK